MTESKIKEYDYLVYLNRIFFDYHTLNYENDKDVMKELIKYESIYKDLVSKVFIPEPVLRFKSSYLDGIIDYLMELDYPFIKNLINKEKIIIDHIKSTALLYEDYEILQNITKFEKITKKEQ